MMKRPHGLALALCVMALFAGVPCANAQDDRLSVVATFSILGDFAQRVGGDRIVVQTLVGRDSNAHVYAPRPADAVALARADVILVNGLLFEGFLQRLVEASGTSAAIAVLSEGAEIIHDPEGGHHHGIHGDHNEAGSDAEPDDPHAWQSLANARVYVRNIARAFCTADAGGCATYHANAEAYLNDLNGVEQEIRQAIDTVAADRRVVVVAHHAFRYFERDFGVVFLAPQGVSTESEASAANVASLVREIRAHRAVAVFAENTSDRRLVTQIAAEAGLKLGGTLYSDALSQPGGPAATYIDLMRHNVATLVAAMAGN